MPGPLVIPAVWGIKEILTLLLGGGAAYLASKQLSKNPPKLRLSRSSKYEPYNPPARPAVETVSQPAGLDLATINTLVTKQYLDSVAKGVPATLNGLPSFGQPKGNYWDYSTFAKDILKYGPNTFPTLTVVGTNPYTPLMLNAAGQDLYRLQAAAKRGEFSEEDMNIVKQIIEEKKKSLSQPEPPTGPKKPNWYKDSRFWKGVGAGATMKAAYDLYQGYKNQPNESDSTFNVMYNPDAAKTYIDNVPATEVPAVQSIDTTNVQSVGTQQDYFDELYRFMQQNN